MNNDPYEICAYVRSYQEKNCYAPNRAMIKCSDEFLSQLVANDVVKVLPLYPNGPPVVVVLTEKGLRMSNTRRKR